MTHTSLPPLHVVDALGRRLRVQPASPADTIGDVGRALTGTPTSLWIDGDHHGQGERLASCAALVEGADVALTPPVVPSTSTTAADAGEPDPVAHVALLTVVAGPACARPVMLAAGRHGIGRSPAMSVAIDDPAIEPHHGLLDVSSEGRVWFTQLTGRAAAGIDDEPVANCGAVALPAGSMLRLGASSIVVNRVAPSELPRLASPPSPSGAIDASVATPWRRALRRVACERLDDQAAAIVVPGPVGEHPRPPATALIGAGCALGGAVLVAALLGQLLFALFAVVGAGAAVVTWLVGLATAWRRRRADRRRRRREIDVFRTELHDRHERAMRWRRVHHPGPDQALARPDLGFRDVWCRRVEDGRADVVLGVGDVRDAVALVEDPTTSLDLDLQRDHERAAHLVAVPVPVTLGGGEVVGVAGSDVLAPAVVRSLIVQLATWYGPADVGLTVVTTDRARWNWVRWLPHGDVGDGAALIDAADHTVIAERAAAVSASTVPLHLVVIDDPGALVSRTGPVRRFLDRTGCAAVVTAADGETVPAICDRVLLIGSTGNAMWSGSVLEQDQAWNLRPAGLTERTASRAARQLAHLVDPEADDASGRSLPRRVGLAELLRPASDEELAAAIARCWGEGGTDPAPCAPVGVSADGVVDLDLVRDGPHALIAGTTGAGKSEFLRTLVVALAARVGPEHLSFVLVDYKGGATFDGCRSLPHTVGLVTDLDDGLAARALASLDAEVRRRERLLRTAGAVDLAAYRAAGRGEPIARLVIIVDEFAALAHELPEFLDALVDVARRGRSLGVHLVLATQRPAGVVDDDVRANTDIRIALRVADRPDAREVLGDERAAGFPRDVPGRAAMRLGSDEVVVFQAASTGERSPSGRARLTVEVLDPVVDEPLAPDRPCARDGATLRRSRDDDPHPSELERIVEAIDTAARRTARALPPAPWLDALPERLSASEVRRACAELGGSGDEPHDAVGLVDDPGSQARRPLRWDAAAGNLAVIGAAGTGRSSTLLSLATARCRVDGPDRCHVYVIDATADARYDALATVAHCGAVVRLNERERLHRLVARLAGELDDRASTAVIRPRIILIIDGVTTVRGALSSIEDAEVLGSLDRVFADGPAVGIVAAFSADAGATAALTVPAGDRWWFHTGDGANAPPATCPGVPPGRPGRIRVASSGLEAQVALGADELAALPGRDAVDGPRPVECLPAMVEARELTGVGAAGRSGVALSIGRAFTDLGTATIEIPPGDHVLIAGTARTGVSTALALIAAQWDAVRPEGVVVVHGAEGSDELLGDAIAADRPVLLVVDDAHRVSDRGTLLLDATEGRVGDVTVVAGGRLDALRAAYGHWTRELARSRCGVILTAPGEVDGELLGVSLPRRTPVRARPGLAWVIDGGGARLVQLAAVRTGAAHPDRTGASAIMSNQGIRSDR